MEYAIVLDTVSEERHGLSSGVTSWSALSADGNVAVYATASSVDYYDVSQRTIHALDDGRAAIGGVATSSTGRFILWSRREPREIVRYDRMTQTYEMRAGFGEVSLSSDGRRFAVSEGDSITLGEF
jgi:hypothetical protein